MKTDAAATVLLAATPERASVILAALAEVGKLVKTDSETLTDEAGWFYAVRSPLI